MPTSELYRRIELPKVPDPRGNLTYIESEKHVGFPIKRVFYIYDVPGGTERGGHALRNCRQFLIAISGSFDVVLENGRIREKIHLNRSYYGIDVPPMTWRSMGNFSSGSVCLVLASEPYSDDDYFRDYDAYIQTLRSTNK